MELCVKLAIYENYTEMHGHQNIKFYKRSDDFIIEHNIVCSIIVS
jgi:hypothetical protein